MSLCRKGESQQSHRLFVMRFVEVHEVRNFSSPHAVHHYPKVNPHASPNVVDISSALWSSSSLDAYISLRTPVSLDAYMSLVGDDNLLQMQACSSLISIFWDQASRPPVAQQENVRMEFCGDAVTRSVDDPIFKQTDTRYLTVSG